MRRRFAARSTFFNARCVPDDVDEQNETNAYAPM
jgi:hypothetical protein